MSINKPINFVGAESTSAHFSLPFLGPTLLADVLTPNLMMIENEISGFRIHASKLVNYMNLTVPYNRDTRMNHYKYPLPIDLPRRNLNSDRYPRTETELGMTVDLARVFPDRNGGSKCAPGCVLAIVLVPIGIHPCCD